jgi:5-methylcytosine-specific restriction endonuclease McrA
VNPCPKLPPKEKKQPKPLKRTWVKRYRSRPRKGRLRGEEMSALRKESWEGRGSLCFYCGKPCSEISGELAHIRGKRMWGDTKENTAPAHKECHRRFHAYGPTLEKPCKAKERAQ